MKVSGIADRAIVSMKTLYNYFSTKESMVLDDADELIDDLAAALRHRQAVTSITDTFVGALEASMERGEPGERPVAGPYDPGSWRLEVTCQPG